MFRWDTVLEQPAQDSFGDRDKAGIGQHKKNTFTDAKPKNEPRGGEPDQHMHANGKILCESSFPHQLISSLEPWQIVRLLNPACCSARPTAKTLVIASVDEPTFVKYLVRVSHARFPKNICFLRKLEVVVRRGVPLSKVPFRGAPQHSHFFRRRGTCVEQCQTEFRTGEEHFPTKSEDQLPTGGRFVCLWL